MAATSSQKTQQTSKPITTSGLLHLGVVYIVWSSTYLAIRVAVREGAGFPPFTLGVMRMAAAGLLLFTWARLKKQKIRATRKELLVLTGSGILLWSIANGLVMFAEQRADSGLAALLLATLPIWVTVIESILDRKMPNFLLAFSLLIGFCGIGVLVAPSLMQGVRADVISIVALIGGAISWGSGTILQARNPVSQTATVSSAYQMSAGSIGFIILMLLNREPSPTPSPSAWLAYAYLVVFGTLAFISFVLALRLLPVNIVMTYAYVNPVLAVILGWLILGEQITWWTVAGTILVLLGVAGVYRARYK